MASSSLPRCNSLETCHNVKTRFWDVSILETCASIYCSLNSLKYDLTCVICSELYTEPLTITCGHSFCKECLLRWAKYRYSQYGKELESFSTIPCPLCKQKISLGLLQKVKINVSLQKLVSRWQDEETCVSNEVNTDWAEFCTVHPTQKVEFLCLLCATTVCSSCTTAEGIHFTREHRLQSLTDITGLINSALVKWKSEYAAPLTKDVDTSQPVGLDFNAMEVALNTSVNQLHQDLLNYFEVNDLLCKNERDIVAERLSNRFKIQALDVWYQIIDKTDTVHSDVDETSLNIGREVLETRVQNRPSSSVTLRQSKGFWPFRHKVRQDQNENSNKPKAPFIKRFCFGTRRKAVNRDLHCGDASVGCSFVMFIMDKKIYPLKIGTFSQASSYDLCHSDHTYNSLLTINRQGTHVTAIDVLSGSKSILLKRQGCHNELTGVCGKASKLFLHIVTKTDNYALLNVTHTISVQKGVRSIASFPRLHYTTCSQTAVGEVGTLKMVDHLIFMIRKGALAVMDLEYEQCFYPDPCLPFDSNKLLPFYVQDIVTGKGADGNHVYLKGNGRTVHRYQAESPFRRRCGISFDTSTLSEISCMAADEKGHLWVIDRQQNLLALFSSNGKLEKGYLLAVEEYICQIFAYEDSLLILSQNCDDQGTFWKIPYSSLE